MQDKNQTVINGFIHISACPMCGAPIWTRVESSFEVKLPVCYYSCECAKKQNEALDSSRRVNQTTTTDSTPNPQILTKPGILKG